VTSDEALAGLRQHQADRSSAKHSAVLTAIVSAGGWDVPVTIASIAREAGVSREFIHSHADLHAAVFARKAELKRKAEDRGRPSSAIQSGEKADRVTLLSQVEKQRVLIQKQAASIAALEFQRSKWLGSQLARFDESPTETVSDLRITNERLSTDKLILTNTVVELRRQIGALQSDVDAVRQLLREGFARTVHDDRPEVPLGILKPDLPS